MTIERRKMSMSYDKYRKELGKMCNTGLLTTLIAIFVTPRLTNVELSTKDYILLGIVAFVFGLLGFILLSENKPEPKSAGKWKRIQERYNNTRNGGS